MPAASTSSSRGGSVQASATNRPTSAGSTKKRFKFPDGSQYSGEVRDGRLCGHGEWRSPHGDSYVGTFVDDAFNGQGRYTDAAGNCFVGGFESGQFHGPGTYFHADGRAEVGLYVAGNEKGAGARWSPDRAQAWALSGGEVAGEVALAEAAELAAALGLTVPESIYALSPKAHARLQEALAPLACDGELDGERFETYGPAASLRGGRHGPLIVHSKRPVVDARVCDAVVAEVEARAAAMGGWTTQRHANYPTTDMPLQQLPRALAWFRESLLPEVAYPFLAEAFGFALPAPEAKAAFRVIDAFVVKYNAASGQRELKPHRDGSVVSFNVALNHLAEYGAGGTYFRRLEGEAGGEECGRGSVRSPKGHILAHSSALLHGGHPITSGVRYLLVAFVTVEDAWKDWAYRFYEEVHAADGPENDPASEPSAADVVDAPVPSWTVVDGTEDASSNMDGVGEASKETNATSNASWKVVEE